MWTLIPTNVTHDVLTHSVLALWRRRYNYTVQNTEILHRPRRIGCSYITEKKKDSAGIQKHNRCSLRESCGTQTHCMGNTQSIVMSTLVVHIITTEQYVLGISILCNALYYSVLVCFRWYSSKRQKKWKNPCLESWTNLLAHFTTENTNL